MMAPHLNEDDATMVLPTDLSDGTTAMEVVGQREAVSTVENQPVDDHEPQSGKFTWTIANFSNTDPTELFSESFEVGGYKWCVLLADKKAVDHLSVYFKVADSESLPWGWSKFAHFSLAAINQIDPKMTVKRGSQYRFNERGIDWGFSPFMPLQDLHDPSKGFLVNDTLIVEADVNVRNIVEWYWAYDCKRETGCVGLKNQGATCYMNSLLQTLYHLPYFRKAVYHMPTTENDVLSNSIPLALQSVFHDLQYSGTSVATNDLTKSFGWDVSDALRQHDVQELNRILCAKLEEKMKQTAVEGTIQELFEGHHMNYIECVNVDYKSTRKESFYDLQLDVKGCKDVYESFDKYVEVEKLEGENQYQADEQHGLQDAKKGVLFIDFPPVLQLQLKRFEFDYTQNTMVKINDRYEFPLQLDLDREDGKYLSPDANRSVRNLYTLHSVLVHRGTGVHGGHYYAFIRPTLSDQWYKFDDECVTKEELNTALEEQYGGEGESPQTNLGFRNEPFKFTKISNAYMLVYIRECDKDKIVCDVDEEDIAEHLRIRLKKVQEEKERKRKEAAEAHFYTTIKVARDYDLEKQIGTDTPFDLVDHDKVWSFRVLKQAFFTQFKEEVAKEFGIPVVSQRFWLWVKRSTEAYRPYRPLTEQEESQTVGHLMEASNQAHSADLKLFLEVPLQSLDHGIQVPPSEKTEDILLFFKLYNPATEELRYVGRTFVKADGCFTDILERLNEMAGFASDDEIQLYEEISFEPGLRGLRSLRWWPIDNKSTFSICKLEHGDIIWYQKTLTREEEEENYRYPNVPLFFRYFQNRLEVHFRRLEKPNEDEFCLELSIDHTYDEVVEKIAQKLVLDDASKIRLTSHSYYSQQPNPHPYRYRGVERLSDMLVRYEQTSDILYFETLDLPLPELQDLKTVKVAFHSAKTEALSVLYISLPKQSSIGDVINELKGRVELSSSEAELRIVKVVGHRISKVLFVSDQIDGIRDRFCTLRAEEIPEEEKDLGPQDSLIHVYHFTQNMLRAFMIQNFGEPFLLVVRENDTLVDVKERIRKKLQVADEEFAKWKFAILLFGRPEYLEDGDVVTSHFRERSMYAYGALALGLEHTDSAAKPSLQSNQNRYSFEKPLRISN